MEILKAAAISIASINAHVIENLKCTQPFTPIPTIMALEANGFINKGKMERNEGVVSFKIQGDWKLGQLRVKEMHLRFTDDFHKELLPEIFDDSNTPGVLPPNRYEFIFEATVEEVTKWYEKTIDVIDLQPIYIFDELEDWKVEMWPDRWPNEKAITSLACTPHFQ